MILSDSLFHGIAVVIDDEVNDNNAGVKNILAAIEQAGCHVVQLDKIPNETSVANLREVAFFVLDWNLYGAGLKEISSERVQIPEGIEQSNEESIVSFLRELRNVRFAPVFIFTNEPVEDIVEKLKAYTDLYDENDPSHILVMSKASVNEQGLFSVLSEWLKKAPSVYVLKSWEREYEKAKNQLFLDFYVKSTLWPLIIWKNFESDNLPPAALLGDLIGRNLVSRMAPFACDLEPYITLLNAQIEAATSHDETVRRVLEGERFLAAARLDEGSIQTGDIFFVDNDYLINIRPDCDCIPKGHDTLNGLDFYLLKGSEISLPDLTLKYELNLGLLVEQDNEAIIFPVNEGKAIRFKFRKLFTQKGKTLEGKRIGRLLPPYLTRLQQRYASYLQRPGLSRLPSEVFPKLASDAEDISTDPAEPLTSEQGVPTSVEAGPNELTPATTTPPNSEAT